MTNDEKSTNDEWKERTSELVDGLGTKAELFEAIKAIDEITKDPLDDRLRDVPVGEIPAFVMSLEASTARIVNWLGTQGVDIDDYRNGDE